MTSDVFETKASDPVSWTGLPERGTLTSLQLIAWIATHIGRWAARLLLYPVTTYYVITASAACRTLYEYLKQMRGYPAHWWHVFRHFLCFATTILDRVYLLRGEFQRFEVKLHGKEILHRRMERKGLHSVGLTLGQLRSVASSGRDAGKVPSRF